MKIGILTLPLHTNYGGILQAWALQTVLERMGHEVKVLNRVQQFHSYSFRGVIKSDVKNFIKQIINNKNAELLSIQRKNISQAIRPFIDKYINLSEELLSFEDIYRFARDENFDAYIVGSDQVWRPRYVPYIDEMFFSFDQRDSILKIAYAVSFGTDKCEYTSEQSTMCSKLLHNFTGVSVRELSGVNLCRECFNHEAIEVLDPTLLLQKNDYLNLVDKEIYESKKNGVFAYILDETKEKNDIIHYIADLSKQNVFTCMPPNAATYKNYKKNPKTCIFPPLTQWIKSFDDAEMVVTDSFHGTVFSIIFNKPFWVIGNKERGMSRFESLLNLFGLEYRLINGQKSVDWMRPIDWDTVNKKRVELCKLSLQFLTSNLNRYYG